MLWIRIRKVTHMIGTDKQQFWMKNCNHFLTKTKQNNGLIEYAQHRFWISNKKKLLINAWFYLEERLIFRYQRSKQFFEHKIAINFLPIALNMHFGYSNKEAF